MLAINIQPFIGRNNCYRHIKTCRNIVVKLLLVLSVYFLFGVLSQNIYADSQALIQNADHGQVFLKPAILLQYDNVNSDVQDNYIKALKMKTDVNINVTVSIARATVTQQFRNTGSYWAEGIYTFPLPEKAAIDHFRITIGERTIEGQVKEKNTARKIYQHAKQSGKKTSLIEQQRPNVFTTSVANIAPGEIFTVELQYQQVIDFKNGEYRLRYPMVTAPRYNAKQNDLISKSEHNPATEPMVVVKTDENSGKYNPTYIHILLDSGVNLQDLKSSYHRIDIKQTDETRYSISTVGENILSDRDFELVWKPQITHQPQINASTQHINGEKYTMLTLFPPEDIFIQQQPMAREVVFVLDISGSMAGTSIRQAKSALIKALERLHSFDRFNLVWFNDQANQLFPGAVTANLHSISQTTRFITELEASGGTEVLPAIKLALSQQSLYDRYRQVIFLTDGNISNEQLLFSTIEQLLGNSRLFTIGIGSAPNSYFMRQAAIAGRGSYTYIGNLDEVEQKTEALFKKLENPALINIKLDLPEDKYEIYPEVIPDLYAGETQTLFIKGDIPESITLRGDYAHTEWQQNATVVPAYSTGIDVAWSREKISTLMAQLYQSASKEKHNQIRQTVTDTALKHHLLSQFTSLVAVDTTPVDVQRKLYKQHLYNNLPKGWATMTTMNHSLVLAQTATGWYQKLKWGLMIMLASITLYRIRQTLQTRS